MRRRAWITWLALGLTLLVFFNLPQPLSLRLKAVVREGVAPLQRVGASWSTRVRDAWDAFKGIGGAVAERRAMAEEVALLRSRIRDIKDLDRENDALRSQLQFMVRSDKKLLPSEVIGRDVSGWWQTVRLGKGSSAEIQVDTPVITTDGLIGRVTELSPGTADVLLISDPSCYVSVIFPRSGAFGVLQGEGLNRSGTPRCRVDFINKDTVIREGDELVTSGLGGVFPSGLTIGYVEKIKLDESGLYQYASVVPKADLGRLNYVFAVLDGAGPAVYHRAEAAL